MLLEILIAILLGVAAGTFTFIMSVLYLSGWWMLMSLVWFLPALVCGFTALLIQFTLTGGSYPVEYKITSQKLAYPAWRGWYEIGYPTNRHLIQPGPRGEYKEALIKDIERVEVKRSKRDLREKTASIIIHLPSGLYKKGSGANKVVTLEHVSDFEKAVKLLKR